jgi:hypothetical protein
MCILYQSYGTLKFYRQHLTWWLSVAYREGVGGLNPPPKKKKKKKKLGTPLVAVNTENGSLIFYSFLAASPYIVGYLELQRRHKFFPGHFCYQILCVSRARTEMSTPTPVWKQWRDTVTREVNWPIRIRRPLRISKQKLRRFQCLGSSTGNLQCFRRLFVISK